MHQDRIETYFSKKGINVIFNTLGHTPELTHSFVSDYRDIVDKSPRKKSQFVKMSTYSDMYTFEVRPKLTGFEHYKTKDKLFRDSIQKFITEHQYSPSLQVDNIDLDKTKSYKTLLSNSLEKIENPLLYLSGGLDSELVAYAFLEKNIKFKTVIFEYVDDNGKITNLNDISYAYKFCKRNGIIPEIMSIDIDKLWDSEYFKRLAIDLQYASPQLSTYAHMVELMSAKYPTATHLFGGEVKFFTDYWADNGERANIVLLAKVTPSYDNQNYGWTATCSTGSETSLAYFNDGSWSILGFDYVQEFTIVSGSWYSTTPTFNYMIRVSSIQDIGMSSQGYVTPQSAPSPFANITPQAVPIIVQAGGVGYGGSESAYITCTTELREIGQTFPGLFASLTLYAASVCF